MKNDYLWDGGGPPDPQVERLERLLSEFRSRRLAPDLPVANQPSSTTRQWTAIAAAVIVAVAAGWLATRGVPDGWQVARSGSSNGRLAMGETLETGAKGHATVNVGDIGVVEVGPNSRLRRVRAGNQEEQRMALDVGEIHALIWAPPRSFVVDTPSAVATDLGCSYTLKVNPDGAGLVTVTSGWVGFERNGHESFIPRGAACQTRPGIGPGTPYREDASPAFRQALENLDFANGGDPALTIVLTEATKDDAFTLWHLLARGSLAQKQRVYDVLASLAPPPAGVTRDGILQSEAKMRDAWWDQLGLGDTTWWRHLESHWPR